MNIKKIKITLFLLMCSFFLVACEEKQEEYVARNQSQEESQEEEKSSESLAPDNIFVYISGQVRKPGVYELKNGSRIYEVIEAAGGLMDQADLMGVNQAALVKDQDMIIIPKIGEAVADNASSDKGLININTAGIEVLSTLPGIGLSKAQSIISYREKNGRFKTIEDIQQIEGIKSGVFNKIKDSITV